MKLCQDTLSRLDEETLNVLKAKVDAFAPCFQDDPAILSGWGHRYFCEIDGGRLRYDSKSANVHRCQCCGREYRDPVLDQVWQTFYRNDAVVTALVAAVVYRATGEQRYRREAETILGFYAENIRFFAIHNKNGETYPGYQDMAWGCGRIMPQGLNEAIFAIRIALTMEILDGDASADLRQGVRELFLETYRLLRPQVNAVHNISCWLLSAIGVMGLQIGDGEMVRFAFDSEYGMRRQLRQGVTRDGFWYEGSIHYNFFLLEGVSYLALFAHEYGYDFDQKALDTLSFMLERAYAYAFDSGVFPNPNDGWPDINLKTYLHVYHTFARVFAEHSIPGNLVKNIEAAPVPRVGLPMAEPFYIGEIPLEKLMFNLSFCGHRYVPVRRSSYHYPLSNFAMLREGKTNVFLKYGLNGSSHAHPDIMNMEIARNGSLISRDLSNAGYSSQLCNRWHRTTFAHNTVVFNGRNITSVSPGKAVEYENNRITAQAENVYAGVTYRRQVSVRGEKLADEFRVFSQEAGVFDYVLHLEKDVLLDRPEKTAPAQLDFEDNGYQYACDVVVCEPDGQALILTACGRQGKLRIRVSLDGDKRLFLCKTPDNPLGAYRTTLVVRSREREPVFRTEIRFQEDK